MYQPSPESEKVLQQLRKLNRIMSPADPDPIEVRQFRDLFMQLDGLLKSGAILPPSWITRLNIVTHKITDFDPPPQGTPGFAWCGHRYTMGSNEYCNVKACGNYYDRKRV